MERKLLSILFVDLVDSTRLVTGADPEIVRRRVADFFDHVQRCAETHGGTVGKYAGDSVMVAFGIPQAHEDDTERAVRTGLSILEAVPDLGLRARVGVESGEVLTDEDDTTFATGEAINVAVRLQQAAEPGELLIGPAAHNLTLGRVQTEDLGPLELRGLDRSIWAWRVLGTADGPPVPTLGSPFVGREEEMELLENTFSRVERNGRAHLFTIYGEPGVGKSRLAREFLESLEGATVLSGRCLPYGEGITYWPLAEMVKVAAGISDDDPVKEAFQKLRDCCEDEAVADLLALASGVLEAVEEERSQQEIAWAARQWAEQLAQPQPLVLVFEDIHWAEEPLLELVESLAASIREAPALLLCLARPELLDVRPGWGGGRLRATSIELEPLAGEESEQLVDALLLDHDVSIDRADVVEKTGGNPLFVEETIRMLVEQGGNGAAERIPDSVQALIAARIDRLPARQKAVLQRAAVIGPRFWPGAVAYLSQNVDEVDSCLEHLLDRELVLRDARSSISGQEAYRFKHVLIREVAYTGLSKSARAAHHERFAAWLREHAGEELLEIRANHLDHACRLHEELDGAAPPELAGEAAAVLQKVGKRALAREDNRYARRSLLRAVELEPTLERRYLAAKAAWRLTDLPMVSLEMEAVREAAAEAGDKDIEGLALAALAEVTVLKHGDLARAREFSDRSLALLTEPDVSRFAALEGRTALLWATGDLEEHENVASEALEIARKIGRKDLESEAANDLASNYLARLKLDKAQKIVDRALALSEESGGISARGLALRFCGLMHQQLGELREAQESFQNARALLSEAGAAWSLARTLLYAGWTAWELDDTAEADLLFRESIKILTPLQDRATLCESQRSLAQLLASQGRLDEAERLAVAARATVGPDDTSSLVTTTMALGVVRAAQGRDAEAEELLRDALARIQATDFRRNELEQLDALAQFLRERGRMEEASELEERRDELLGAARAPSVAA